MHDLNPNVYIFGSFPTFSCPSDVDALLVYQPENNSSWSLAVSFRKHLEIAIQREMELPADIVLLTHAEEAELQFTQVEAAIRIWP